MYDYLIVGAGLYGSVFAYIAKQKGKSCFVIEKRPFVGGNIRCEEIEGINVHKYGPHIFHTDKKNVWNFVNQFVEFNRFTLGTIANYKGEVYNLPFNMNTFHQMWNVTTPAEAQAVINEQKNEALKKMKADGIEEPRNLEEQALTLIGKDIFEKLIKGYTEKQWGRNCSELPAFIIKRLPFRFVYDNNYFKDPYEGIPIGGYNQLIVGLLKDIEVIDNVDFFKNRAELSTIAKNTVFTGKIDEFFNYQYGNLEYRTVAFVNEVLDTPNYQGNAIVNYTDRDVPYTRIIEHKHFESFGRDVYKNPKTIITREYSTEWKLGTEPYYPVNDKKNSELYLKYRMLADKETSVIFGGRLAEYRYYDMDDTINAAFMALNNCARKAN